MIGYRTLSVALLLLGILLALSYIFVQSVPLAAPALSAIILGLTGISLAGAKSPDSAREDRRVMVHLTTAFFGFSILLALLRQQDFGVYLITYSLSFLVITLASVKLSASSRARLNVVASIVFAAFLFVFALRIAALIS